VEALPQIHSCFPREYKTT